MPRSTLPEQGQPSAGSTRCAFVKKAVSSELQSERSSRSSAVETVVGILPVAIAERSASSAGAFRDPRFVRFSP